MNSIGEECTELKREYDACFNAWFSDKFLKGKYKNDPCAGIFQKYQACVKQAIRDKGINLDEIEKPVLGTSNEQQTPANTTGTSV
ncbi:TP53-regulated inhibitor of apoptosis 1-like [Amphiura filiformis]|uniref:TP53-regulated inhibitor of apoptosis 1-like n=1 Tax=Amphiura filiformis TaxID=82378 RepID=UPI003B22158D